MFICFSAINIENNEANKIKNVLTGEWGGVPDVARIYKSKYCINFNLINLMECYVLTHVNVIFDAIRQRLGMGYDW